MSYRDPLTGKVYQSHSHFMAQASAYVIARTNALQNSQDPSESEENNLWKLTYTPLDLIKDARKVLSNLQEELGREITMTSPALSSRPCNRCRCRTGVIIEFQLQDPLVNYKADISVCADQEGCKYRKSVF